MFKSILINQNIKLINKINLLRACSTNSINLNENKRLKRTSKRKSLKINDEFNLQINESNQLIKRDNETNLKKRKHLLDDLQPELRNDYRIKQMYNYYNDELVLNLDKITNLNELLNIIEQFKTNLRIDHLVLIYEKINLILLNLKEQNLSINEFKDQLINSSTYNLILLLTLKWIRELDTNCLTNCLKTFSYLNQDTETKIVNVVLEMLKHKLNYLEIDEINDCLIAFEQYSNLSPKLVNIFKNGLLEVACNKLMANQFDTDNIELIIKFIELFKKNKLSNSFKVITYLIEKLDKDKLNFKQSIKLLKLIKELRFFNSIYERNNLAKIYFDLIYICKMIIYEKLALDNLENDFNYYLNELHNQVDSHSLYLDCYNYNVLELLSSFIIKNQTKLDKIKIYNLVINYSRCLAFNENLLKLIYKFICNDYEFRTKIHCYTVYNLLSKYRLQFIDYELLINKLFTINNNPKFKDDINSNRNSLNLLLDLILKNIFNLDLFNYLLNETKFLDINTFRRSAKSQFQNLILSKIYLNNLSNLDNELKLKIEQRLNEFLFKFVKFNPKPLIDKEYLKFNKTIQKNCYLSNGIYLNEFCIYDQSINKLIDLTNYENYFNKIDKIPLDNNQLLIIFNRIYPLQIDIDYCETFYSIRLKELIQNSKIKFIDINTNQLNQLDIISKTKYLIKKVNDQFGTYN